MSHLKLNLRALEVFESASRTRSLSRTAQEMGCAVSLVSHHLKRLEAQLGVALFDFSQRPIALTAAGAAFERRVAAGLHLIRLGVHDSSAADSDDVRMLRIALVEEFENRVATDLLIALAERMPNTRFQLTIQPSYDALANLRSRKLDVAVVSEPADLSPDLVCRPLMRDPFVIAAPRDHDGPPERLLSGQASLPFLRYNAEHVIGRQVAAHLRRRNVALDDRFEIDSNQSILGMIAEGRGWSITTVLGYLRAARFQDRVQLHPPPGPAFSRYIAAFTLADFPVSLTEQIEQKIGASIRADIIEPAVSRFDWLADRLELLSVADPRSSQSVF